MQIYLVGGAVRDRLLNRPVTERDWVVVGSTPEQMITDGFKPVGKDFPVFLHPKTHEEYALARTERKTAAGYHGFTFHADENVTLEEDLARRDLTVNAIAEDDNGKLIDPFNGVQDINNKTLRHVSAAFAEDPVRILRIARFAARYASYGFTIAEETLSLMSQMVNDGEVNALVAERVWQETQKALSESTPSIFFNTLKKCGALNILFPEIHRLFGVPQPEQYHPEIDTGIHTLMVVDAAAKLSDDPATRFAALTHDLGKGSTPLDEWPTHHGHEQRSVTLVKALCERLKTPSSYKDLAMLAAEFHGHVHKVKELRPNTIVMVLERCDVFRKPERFEQLLIACEADSRGRTGWEDKPYPQRAWFSQCAEAARNVDIQELIKQGLSGEQLKQAIHEKRIRVVKELKKRSY